MLALPLQGRTSGLIRLPTDSQKLYSLPACSWFADSDHYLRPADSSWSSSHTGSYPYESWRWLKQQLLLFVRHLKYLEVTGVPWPGTSRYSSAATSPSEYAASEVTFFYFPVCQIGNILYPLCSAKEQVLISLYCCYLDFCKCCKNIYLSRSMLNTSFCCWDAFIHAFNCDVFTFGNVLTICHFCPHDKGK